MALKTRQTARQAPRSGAAGKLPALLHLREDFVRSSGKLKVDREKGIIYGVKIGGWKSDNAREYTRDAVQAALPMYEGCKSYCDHPGFPTESRKTRDAIGIFRNPRIEADGWYADLEYYRSHPMAETLCEEAERGLGGFGFSHNADGRGEVDARGVLVVTEIVDVRSVDLVTDPATVKSLSESRKPSMKTIKFSALLEQLSVNAKLAKPVRLKLLEADYSGDSMMDTDVPEPAAETEPMDALKGGFQAALGALVDKALDGDNEALKKITELIKSHMKITGAGAAEHVVEEDDEEGKDDKEGKKVREKDMEEGSDEIRGKNKDGQIRAMWAKDPHGDYHPSNESAKRIHKQIAGNRVLTEAKAKTLCSLAGLEADTALLESIVGTEEGKALKLLEWAKKNGAAKTGSTGQHDDKPRSSAAGHLTEGRQGANGTALKFEGEKAAESRLAFLRGAGL